MTYVNRYIEADNNTTVVYKTVKINEYTYVLGNTKRPDTGIFAVPYIACMDSAGTMLWERCYPYPTVTNGYSHWDVSHVEDLLVGESPEILYALVYDMNSVILLRIDGNEGTLHYFTKVYDRYDTPFYSQKLGIKARLHKFDDNSMVVNVHEIHSDNSNEVVQIDYCLMKIHPYEIIAYNYVRILGTDLELYFREEEVRNNLLHLFGGVGTNAAERPVNGIITLVDTDLKILESNVLMYSYVTLPNQRNYIDIYAVSPLHNDSYLVMGAHHSYEPQVPYFDRIRRLIINLQPAEISIVRNPVLVDWVFIPEIPVVEQYTQYFVAEISVDNQQVLQVANINKNFLENSDHQAYLNSNGPFFSVDSNLYKLRPDFSSMEWVKEIFSTDENKGFILNRSIDTNLFTSWLSADFTAWQHKAFYLASTDLNYESCKTRPVAEDPQLFNSWLRIEEFPLYTQEVRVGYYDVEVSESLNKLGTEFLCGNDPDPDPEDIVLLDAKSRLQSRHLFLQSVGSHGVDSTEGIHIRWQFKHDLMQHLPKGNYYQGAPQGFNKPNDFVRLMRAPYQPVVTTLDFSVVPYTINNTSRTWVYQLAGNNLVVTFTDAVLYAQALGIVNPAVNPLAFVQNYGEGIIEVQHASELFFAVQPVANTTAGNIRLEVLSSEAANVYDFHTTLRKTLTGSAINGKHFIDNGRKVRFSIQGNFVRQIFFEYYTSFINTANNSQWWQLVDNYSLTVDSNVAFHRLEPDPGGHPVHAKWPRYNEGQFVNTDNYRRKWHGPMGDVRNTIQNSVRRYMELSVDPNNPPANETYYPNDIAVDGSGMDVSHLTLLQMASMDFHVARMLGMGWTDVSSPALSNNRFVYVAVYTTFASLNGSIATELRHIAMGLPTSLDDNRPPISVDLDELRPGIFTAGQGAGELTEITGPDGYSHDGKTRYISLFAKEILPNEPMNVPFFYSSLEFNMSDMTFPVYVGIKYSGIDETQWLLPELSHDPQYYNVNSGGGQAALETVGIAVPDPDNPIYIHKITRTGTQVYGSYGIDSFSRGSVYSNEVRKTDTNITPANSLLAPSSVNAFLIEPEAPLLLTSAIEQEMLSQIPTEDKTFIRLVFEYDAAQEMITYLKAVNGQQHQDFDPLPINDEIFADNIEIFFRPEIPKQLFGTIASVADEPGNPLVSIITTAPMVLSSAGTDLYPEIPVAEIPHYIGSVFVSGNDEFIIHQIVPNPADPRLPELHVLKKHLNSAFGGVSPVLYDPTAYLAPQVGESFMIVENMLNEISWGAVNPHSFTIEVGTMWQTHEEEVTIEAGEGNDVTLNTYLRRFRGFAHEPVKVERYNNDFTGQFEGMYLLVFEGFLLDHHPQYTDVVGEISVDWYRGSVRVPYEDNPGGELKTLKIIRMENIGTSADLFVYAQDENYQDDPLQNTLARTAWVNLYPGYRCYLYEDGPSRLTEEHIYSQDENILDKYSIFGIRSRLYGNTNYISDISVPSMMFARRHELPETPEVPTGAIYATKPDYYGRSSFTFNTKYTHKPFALSFVRSNDDLLLSAFYIQTPYGGDVDTDSVEDIRRNNDDEFFADRLLALANLEIDQEELFPVFGGYRFPRPNNPQFFASINVFIDEHNTHYGDNIPHIAPENIDSFNQVIIPEVPGRNAAVTFLDFMKEIISNVFVPLTEIPAIYNYMKGASYQPVPKLQVIRDRNGALLKPTDPDFDIAPMAKILDDNPHKTQFTDFTLDGNSSAVYFYAVREVNSQMQQGSLSRVIGPVRMVNSYAVQPPEIVSIVPVLENTVLGITPKVEITINAYDAIRKIKKLNLYRTFEPANVHDIRNMELIRTIDLENEGLLNDTIWTVTDDFSGLAEVPYSDPLYYRITVEAQIEYAEANYSYDDNDPNNQFNIVTDFAAGAPSKLIITAVQENKAPESPELSFTSQVVDTSTIGNVAFQWDKQAYKGKYYLYKMNTQGNWVQIAMVAGNSATFELNLIDTDWNTDQLVVKDTDGSTVYHHFKMLAENTAGMFSIEEKVLTIPSA